MTPHTARFGRLRRCATEKHYNNRELEVTNVQHLPAAVSKPFVENSSCEWSYAYNVEWSKCAVYMLLQRKLYLCSLTRRQAHLFKKIPKSI